MAKVKLAAFMQLTQAALAPYVNNVISLMTTNSKFASVSNEVATLKTLYDAYLISLTDNLIGGRITTLEKNRCKKEMLDQMKIIALNVELVSKGEETIILEAGLDVYKTPQPHLQLDAPKLISVTNNPIDGFANIYFKKVAGANNYSVEVRILKDGKVVEEWAILEYTTKERLQLSGLKSDNYYQFRIQAFGKTGLVSPYSNIGEVLVS